MLLLDPAIPRIDQDKQQPQQGRLDAQVLRDPQGIAHNGIDLEAPVCAGVGKHAGLDAGQGADAGTAELGVGALRRHLRIPSGARNGGDLEHDGAHHVGRVRRRRRQNLPVPAARQRAHRIPRRIHQQLRPPLPLDVCVERRCRAPGLQERGEA